MPASPGVLAAQKVHELATRLRLLGHAVADVRPVEAGDELRRLLQLQPAHDLPAGRGVGGGRDRDPRHPRPALVQQVQLDVFGPEVVPPLRDAVRLVDGKERNRHPLQQPQEALGQQPLRGHITEVQVAGQQRPLHPRLFIPRQRRVQKGRPHPELPQRVHLILHQGDQRRDDDPGPRPQQRRNLVAQRLAAPGRHQHQGIAAAHHLLDDRLLRPAKARVAEDAVQDVQRVFVHRRVQSG